MQPSTEGALGLASSLLDSSALRDLAELHLGSHGIRWLHTQGVGAKAEWLAPRLPIFQKDRDKLVNAAWLHDIGYAFPELHQWHPVAGARFLDSCGLGDIAPFVAWHSTADYEAELLGHEPDLASWKRHRTLVQDALDWCDMTTSPTGFTVSIYERLAEVGHSHGERSPQYMAMKSAMWRLKMIDGEMSKFIR